VKRIPASIAEAGMENQELLELCVKVSGAFENGAGASYTALAGNFDGMGLSAGILQWNAGQGSLQPVVLNIGNAMGWDKAQTFFNSDIHHFAVLRPAEAVQWCLDNYIEVGGADVDPAAKKCWVEFLGQPESIAAQIQIATNGILRRAGLLAAKFCPDYLGSTRVLSFFFDLVTQSGGMQNRRGKVEPIPSGQSVDVSEVLAFAHIESLKCAAIWEVAVQNDPKARLLLHYAYERSKLSNPLYIWDACSRRGSIACRSGYVHDTAINLFGLLD
jgi:hypothetical protein